MNATRIAATASFALAGILVACAQASTMAATISVRSSAFAGNGAIPPRYTCSGADVSPPLSWNGVPSGAQSLAITVIDPDAPGQPFTHWVVYDIPGEASDIPEDGPLPAGSAEGRNDFGGTGYRGPCPPPGSPHHYRFKVYAVDTRLSLRSGASRQAFEDAIEGHVLVSGEMVGTFRR